MKEYLLLATTAFGLEAVVKRELVNLEIDVVKVENGKVFFKGNDQTIINANINIRCADRIYIVLKEFEALSFEELFNGVYSIEWEEILPIDAKFIVNGRSQKSKLFSISDCQRITEKAIIKKLNTKYDIEWFEKSGTRYSLEISMLNDIATITLDTSGDGLHKRGYRTRQGEAPIKETLAAAMILLSYWNPDRPFYDPFCGSGTLAIEAAMIGKEIAPGIDRKFDCEQFEFMDKDIIKQERVKAKNKINIHRRLNIMASDIDRKSILVARDNAAEIGLQDDIRFFQKDFREVDILDDYGVLITNPPYGDRLKPEDIDKLYRDFGEKYLALNTWSTYVISSYEKVEQAFKKKADRKRKLYNGMIKVEYYQYYGERPKQI